MRKRFVVTGSVLVFGLALSLQSGTVNAACGQLCTETSFGREDVNTQDTSSGNIGYGFTFGGTRKWSLASFVDGFGTNFFTLFNDSGSSYAIKIQQGSSKNIGWYNGDWRPLVDNDVDLGVSANRWKAVYAVNGTIQTSDARQKKDVVDLRYGLADVMKLRPVSFRWKAAGDGDVHFGLIAQEVERVVPGVVRHGQSDAEPLGINYSDLVPLLINAVKTQQKTIENQAERLERLERRSGIAANSGGLGAGAMTGGLAAIALVPAFGLVAVFRKRRRASAS